MYRVLSRNIVRELLESGHQGHELLDFAGEILQSITDSAWETSSNGAASPRHSFPSAAFAALTRDESGRGVILGGQTLLRGPNAGDVATLERWIEEPLVQKSLIPGFLKEIIQRISRREESPSEVHFIVCDRSTTRPIGLVSLHDIDRTVRQAALAKMIGEPEYRGRGAAHEAARLILHHGFHALGLNRIYLRTLGGNLKNIRLNERIGFRFEGVLQQAAMLDGKSCDVVLMAMLAEEFQHHESG